jgi:hypothetical protein
MSYCLKAASEQGSEAEILKEENHLEDVGVNGRILSNGVQTI